MNAITVLLLLLVCLHGFYALGWWGAGAVLGLNRAAARQWMGYCLCMVVGAGLFVTDLGLAPGQAVAGRSLALLGASVLMRRGLARFGRYPSRDREQALVLLLALLALMVIGTSPETISPRTLAITGLMAWVLLRAGAEVVRGLRAEFGRRTSLLMALPLCLFGVAMLARMAMVWQQLGQPPEVAILTNDGRFNVGLLFTLVVVSALFQLSLVYLVIDRLVRKLRHLSRHDALTGLLNRHAWDQALLRERLQLRRRPRPTALLIIDIDHFKRVNDRHGHLAGDAALRAVATCLQNTARGTDWLARLGGEEFGMLLSDTDLQGTGLVAERVRQAVAGLEIEFEEQLLSVTVSVGAAVMLPEVPGQIDLQALLALADSLLYRAKADGRDRVVIESLTLPPRARLLA
jgi:diguanylate cyclase (GGDEF)-like protein